MNETARILVVEDDPSSRDLVVYLLEEFGYTVSSAGDGETGLEKARSDRPDLIICDIQFPKLDGYGVVCHLKEDRDLRNIPIVAVTALAMIGDRSKILAAGFDGYLTKPISAETFVAEVEHFLPANRRRSSCHNRSAKANAHESQSHPSTRESATILVVDDTPANIDFARSTLEPSGYRVLTATGVEDAITLAEKDRPDLVLCDLHMRPQSGHALLEIAQSNPSLKEIPIAIISSTYTREGERVECLDRGAARFIKRPIEPEALLDEIAQALAQTKTR